MRQIVGYFLLLSFVTVGVISAVAYLQSRNTIKQALFQRLTLTATLKEDELNRWVEDQREEMLAILNLPEVQTSIGHLTRPNTPEAVRQQAEQYLRNLCIAIVERHSSLSEVLVLTPGGRVILSTRPEAEGTFEALVQYSYVPLEEATPFHPNFYMSPNTQESRMSFAIPLVDGTGRNSGLMAMHLNLERIDAIIRKRTGLGKTGETYLIGNQGSSLASYSFFLSGKGEGDFTEGVHSEGIDRAMQGISGQGEYRNYRGVPVVGVYHWLENRDLALLAEISTREAFAPARRLAQTIALTGLGLAALLAIGVYLGARRIARPILAITDAAAQVAAGDLQAQAPVLAHNEIGLLAQVFNQMTQQLRRLYTNLEAEVEDRTAALQQANADLSQAKDAAEVANRAKSEFLANISHELRTPLNAILGFSQLMMRTPAVEPSQREHLEIINRSGEHLLALIDDVLSMAKIEAGLTTLNPSSFDLLALLSSLENMLRVKASAKGLVLEFERSPTVPQYIKTDEGKLRQVLINLLGNAIKFTEQGGVVLRVEPGEDTRLQFTITDTGPGIAPADIPKLFKPFVQASIGHQSQQGTGLGLAISRQFVELMGGHINVTSSPGQGASFHFDIHPQPASLAELTPPAPPRRVIGLAPHQPPCRILVVEDRWENRHLLVSLLKPLGFEVRAAENGQQAIAHWRTWQPHLIWMDMRMPVMDGYEATRRIRAAERGEPGTAAPGTAATPDAREEPRGQGTGQSPPVPPAAGPAAATKIIALTASAFEESRSAVLAAGCDDFVRKPFQEHIILDKMAQHLALEYRYAAPASPTEPAAGVAAEGAGAIAPQTMPATWIEALRQAAIQADGDWLAQLIGEIPPHDGSLADQLTRLQRQFDFDAILDLLDSQLQTR